MAMKTHPLPAALSRVHHWIALLACISATAWAAAQQSPPHPGGAATKTPSASASANAADEEDQRRTEARAYPHALGPVQGIRIRSTRYFDADNRPCAAPPPKSRTVTPRRVRAFLRKAVPVSQIDVMNYYGAFGECTSDWVDVSFADGRRVRMTFAADSGVAYLAPLVDGKEGEVYFYVCEDCGR